MNDPKIKIFNDTMNMIEKSLKKSFKVRSDRPFNPEIVDSEYKRQVEMDEEENERICEDLEDQQQRWSEPPEVNQNLPE